MHSVLKRVIVAVTAGLILSVGVLPMPAKADSGNQITTMDVLATVAEDGSVAVTQTFTVDANGETSFVDLYLATTHHYDDRHDLIVRYKGITITSPSGASTKMDTWRRGSQDGHYDYMGLSIGDKRHPVSGPRTYTMSYTVVGMVAPDARASGVDEMPWTLIVPLFDTPISNLTVTVTGIAPVESAVCEVGVVTMSPCADSSFSGLSAVYTLVDVQPGATVRLVTRWPAGTYPEARAHVIVRDADPLTLKEVGWGPWVVCGGLIVAAIVGIIAMKRGMTAHGFFALLTGRRVLRGRQRRLTDKELDAPAARARMTEGMSPRLAGAISRGECTIMDLKASIFSLAARGYLAIDASVDDPVILPTGVEPEGLDEVDAKIYSWLIPGGESTTSFSVMAASQTEQPVREIMDAMREEYGAQGWYRLLRGPHWSWFQLIGMGIIFAAWTGGVLLGVWLFYRGCPGWAWSFVGPMIFGIGVVVESMGERQSLTPAGEAASVEARGYRLFLNTLCPQDLKDTAGMDVFSEYFPYAVALNSTHSLAVVCTKLLDEGVTVTIPDWFLGDWSTETVFVEISETAERMFA